MAVSENAVALLPSNEIMRKPEHALAIILGNSCGEFSILTKNSPASRAGVAIILGSFNNSRLSDVRDSPRPSFFPKSAVESLTLRVVSAKAVHGLVRSAYDIRSYRYPT